MFYEKDRHLEYDISLTPGSELAHVELVVEGIDKLIVDRDGDLVFETSLGRVRQPPPKTWVIDESGCRRRLAASYELRGPDRFGFSVPDWTGEQHLIVDPEVLWSTFVGGSGPDRAQAMTVDGSGIVTIAGYTVSPNYPTTPGAWSTSIAGNDGFVTRLDPSQPPSQQLLYSTYVGGGVVNAVSVDPSGIITVAGQTTSPTFPTSSGAWSVTFNGVADAFIMRLDPSQSGAQQLLYSTLLGGSDYDEAWAIAVDSSGVVTVGGYTLSVDYPTTAGAWDTSFNGGADAFVARIDPSLSGPQQLTWSTFVGGAGTTTAGGGAGTDHAYGLAVDAAGIVTLVGRTWCADFPTTAGAWDTTHNGFFDGYVTRLDPSQPAAQQLLYSTFLGGNRYDHAFGVSIDAASVVTVTGVTNSSDLPTTQNAWDPTFNGGTDIFVCRLDPTRPASQQLDYSTFLGGPSPEYILQHSADATGIVTLAGTTMGTFPTTVGAFDTTFNGGAGDAFAARLDPSQPPARQLLYSTYLGGGGGDGADSLAVDEEGVVAITGATASTGFPTTAGAWSTVLMGGDAFVTRLDMLPAGVRGVGDSSPGCNGRPAIGVTTVPRVGEQRFSVTCSNAPPTASGWLFGAAASLSTPIPILGARLWVHPGSAFLVTASARSNAVGYAELNLPIPNSPTLAGFRLYTQYAWVGPSAPPPCPQFGISASRALEITVQP